MPKLIEPLAWEQIQEWVETEVRSLAMDRISSD